MLAERDAIASLAVRDVKSAKAFYEGTLGLTRVADVGGGAVVYKAGHTEIIVYQSEYAGTNKATALAWRVGNDFDAVMRWLGSRGVRFEHYDMPGLKREGDFHVADGRKMAWFKDPDGNIFHITSA
ncbi:VOC family protein [Vulgatibacter incomptus]|uniref:VOC domain-containing protein n=1 Tax=Vulgatibacter incomptus TaxID=1391653 RepID=A0A0K1PGC1_9BACT|nr:VOC family protein [Vulgatibacter incomptus]AKU92552.1 hypothetical protein AKJ08_2939 [Vulgatibacter incomptus]